MDAESSADDHDDDDALLAEAQIGSREALNRLVMLHRNGVYRYGLQVCRTTEDAEDAVQETLWAATRAIKTFRGTATSIASWLFTIVRNECFRLLERGRRRHHHHKTVSLPLDDESMEAQNTAASERPGPDEVLIARQRAEVLSKALAQLDPIHREVILLRDIQELSAPEAAERLRISVDALKSRLHRARVNLRDLVESRAKDQP